MEISSKPIKHREMIPSSFPISRSGPWDPEGRMTCTRSESLWEAEQELEARAPDSQTNVFSSPSHTLNGKIQSSKRLSQPIISRPVVLHRGKGKEEVYQNYPQAQKMISTVDESPAFAER